MDTIDRQSAIDKFEPWLKVEGYSEGERNMIKDVLYELTVMPSAQSEQRWIPCSERLPEEGQNCLVCDKGSIGIDAYIGHGNPYNWKWYVRDHEAWMPLPEPYQSEAERRTDG